MLLYNLLLKEKYMYMLVKPYWHGIDWKQPIYLTFTQLQRKNNYWNQDYQFSFPLALFFRTKGETIPKPGSISLCAFVYLLHKIYIAVTSFNFEHDVPNVHGKAQLL